MCREDHSINVGAELQTFFLDLRSFVLRTKHSGRDPFPAFGTQSGFTHNVNSRWRDMTAVLFSPRTIYDVNAVVLFSKKTQKNKCFHIGQRFSVEVDCDDQGKRPLKSKYSFSQNICLLASISNAYPANTSALSLSLSLSSSLSLSLSLSLFVSLSLPVPR